MSNKLLLIIVTVSALCCFILLVVGFIFFYGKRSTSFFTDNSSNPDIAINRQLQDERSLQKLYYERQKSIRNVCQPHKFKDTESDVSYFIGLFNAIEEGEISYDSNLKTYISSSKKSFSVQQIEKEEANNEKRFCFLANIETEPGLIISAYEDEDNGIIIIK